MVKKGFSLAEALVVMLIISVLFSVGAKVITKKPKPQKITNPHGYFECYLNGGTLMQSSGREGIAFEPKEAGASCKFTPPKGVAFFNINTYGRSFDSRFEPNVNNELDIRVSSAGTDFIVITGENGSFSVPAGLNINERDSAQIYFEAMHPNSQICNGGNFGRNGIMISW